MIERLTGSLKWRSAQEVGPFKMRKLVAKESAESETTQCLLAAKGNDCSANREGPGRFIVRTWGLEVVTWDFHVVEKKRKVLPFSTAANYDSDNPSECEYADIGVISRVRQRFQLFSRQQ